MSIHSKIPEGYFDKMSSSASKMVNENKKHSKQQYYLERGFAAVQAVALEGLNLAKVQATFKGKEGNDHKSEHTVPNLIAQFEKDEMAASDFTGCGSIKEKTQRIMQLIPRLGVIVSSKKYILYGYKQRTDDDESVEADEDEDEGELSVTDQFNKKTLLDEEDLLKCWTDCLTEDIPLPQRYGGKVAAAKEEVLGEPEPEPDLMSPEPEPDLMSPVPEDSEEGTQSPDVDSPSPTSAVTPPHKYTSLSKIIEKKDWKVSVNIADEDCWSQPFSKEDGLKMFCIAVQKVPYVAFGKVMDAKTIAQVMKVIARCDDGKQDGKSKCDRQDPAQTNIEWLEVVADDFKLRVFGLQDPSILEGDEKLDFPELIKYAEIDPVSLLAPESSGTSESYKPCLPGWNDPDLHNLDDDADGNVITWLDGKAELQEKMAKAMEDKEPVTFGKDDEEEDDEEEDDEEEDDEED